MELRALAGTIDIEAIVTENFGPGVSDERDACNGKAAGATLAVGIAECVDQFRFVRHGNRRAVHQVNSPSGEFILPAGDIFLTDKAG